MNMREADHDIEQAVVAVRQGGAARERGVLQLDRLLGRRLERYFMHHKVRSEDAEELVWQVWLKVCTNELRDEGRAAVWIWVIARNLLISYHRALRPEVHFDDEDWQLLLERQAAVQAPGWLRLCIERALHRFGQDHPERGEMLRFLAEEWSAREIGAFLGCNEGAARDRLYRTRQKVAPYLAECREPHAV